MSYPPNMTRRLTNVQIAREIAAIQAEIRRMGNMGTVGDQKMSRLRELNDERARRHSSWLRYIQGRRERLRAYKSNPQMGLK